MNLLKPFFHIITFSELYLPEFAIDEDDTTRFISKQATNNWLYIDLLKTVFITRIQLAFEEDTFETRSQPITVCCYLKFTSIFNSIFR